MSLQLGTVLAQFCFGNKCRLWLCLLIYISTSNICILFCLFKVLSVNVLSACMLRVDPRESSRSSVSSNGNPNKSRGVCSIVLKVAWKIAFQCELQRSQHPAWWGDSAGFCKDQFLRIWSPHAAFPLLVKKWESASDPSQLSSGQNNSLKKSNSKDFSVTYIKGAAKYVNKIMSSLLSWLKV